MCRHCRERMQQVLVQRRSCLILSRCASGVTVCVVARPSACVARHVPWCDGMRCAHSYRMHDYLTCLALLHDKQDATRLLSASPLLHSDSTRCSHHAPRAPHTDAATDTLDASL